jgi:predicted O-methyltransferase YrrM
MNITYSFIIEKFGNEFGMAAAYCYYVILSQLSTYFNNSVIVDLGTLRGESAVALAYNKSNKVYTYDIDHREEAAKQFEKVEFQNIKYIIGDCIENNWSGMAMLEGVQPKSDKEIFLSSELIFMDIDPHDGAQEDKVLNFLISNNWKGIMVCDDIGMGREPGKENAHPQMRDWWNTINLPKYDISKNYYAAGTGTGIICFDEQEVIF